MTLNTDDPALFPSGYLTHLMTRVHQDGDYTLLFQLTAGFAAEVTERLPSDALEHWAGHLLAERLHAADGALAGELAGELASESVEGGRE